MAHKCGRGVVTLFCRPLEAACPGCGSAIVLSMMPPAPDARRHRSGTTTTTKAALVRPQSGSNNAARAVPTVPRFVARSVHPKSGVLQGEEVGGGSGSEEESERSEHQALAVEDPVPRRSVQESAPRDLIQVAAIIGDWTTVARLAAVLGWATVAHLAPQAADDPAVADLVRAKLGIDLTTAIWTTWWGALSEEVCIGRAS